MEHSCFHCMHYCGEVSSLSIIPDVITATFGLYIMLFFSSLRVLWPIRLLID